MANITTFGHKSENNKLRVEKMKPLNIATKQPILLEAPTRDEGSYVEVVGNNPKGLSQKDRRQTELNIGKGCKFTNVSHESYAGIHYEFTRKIGLFFTDIFRPT